MVPFSVSLKLEYDSSQRKWRREKRQCWDQGQLDVMVGKYGVMYDVSHVLRVGLWLVKQLVSRS